MIARRRPTLGGRQAHPRAGLDQRRRRLGPDIVLYSIQLGVRTLPNSRRYGLAERRNELRQSRQAASSREGSSSGPEAGLPKRDDGACLPAGLRCLCLRQQAPVLAEAAASMYG
jgi:hypothetical protein